MPLAWKVVQQDPKKLTCCSCGALRQAPAPFDVLPWGLTVSNLLDLAIFERYGSTTPGSNRRIDTSVRANRDPFRAADTRGRFSFTCRRQVGADPA